MHWIPNSVVPCSKPLGGSKVDPAFRPSQMSVVKSKLSPRSYSVALRQLKRIHKKGPYSFFYLWHKQT